jgi:chemotaxis protein methyltransferase CheR
MWPNPIDYFSGLIERETGIVYSESNIFQLKMRLEEFCRVEKISSVDQLAKLFQEKSIQPEQAQRLFDMATNNETLFFRDPKYFTSIEQFIKDDVLKTDPREIKIWSAASSTGQEALSVAMTLDQLSKKIPMPSFSILATDICDKALHKCNSGLYTDFEIKRGLSEDKREQYFRKEGDLWKAKPEIFSKIRYSYNNLIRSSVYDTFHIILCRNVLIYQKVEMRKAVVDTLFLQLEVSGALLLGAGETLVGIREDAKTEQIDGVSFYKKSKLSTKRTA